MRLVLLTGSGRCGSTVVYRALAGHPDVAFLTALDEHLPRPLALGALPARAFRLARRGGDPGPLRRWVAERCQPGEGWPILDRQVAPIMSAPFRDLTAGDCTPWLRRRLVGLFESVARRQGREVVLHKVTGWPRIGLFRAAFPDCRVVHVVRDGRAVASSLLQMPWWPGYRGVPGWSFGELDDWERRAWDEAGRSFPSLAGLEWRRLTRAAAQALAEVPEPQQMLLRYEDFVADPHGRLEDLRAFSGLDPSHSLERHLQGLRVGGGRVRAFEDDLGPAAVAQLSAMLAEDLDRYGYR